MPVLSKSAQSLRPSVFATLAERMKQLPADHLPLHIGDTFRLPPEASRLESIDWAPLAPLYKYTHPFGLAPFLEVLLEKVKSKNQIPAEPVCLQVSCGATGGLASAASTLFDPGDEVLVLAPFWPLIVGILRTAGAEPHQVQFSNHLLADPDFDIEAHLEAHCGSATRGLYFSNPNNPDGLVYTPEQLERVASFCRRKGLWVLSDEAYEDYIYDGRPHTSIAALPGMFERTVTVFTFSKSYAMAGLRLGYVVAPPEVSPALRRVSNHQIYNLSGAVQHAGMLAVQTGAEFLEESKRLYAPARDVLHQATAKYGHKPGGGGYVFLDLGSEEESWDFIHRAMDRGLCSAPGEAFGHDYKHCVRICFTAAPLEGIQRAATLLGELL
ncbi:MAG: pyridoxal phosphate-dependent aminotransferase [Vulcanimicrobiota bacterium]